MEFAVIGALAGLALVDSTSVGTLVLPLVMLMQRRVRTGGYLLYLLTIAVFYWLLGLALLLGASRVASVLAGLDGSRVVDSIQLLVGVGMLALSFWPDTRWAKERAAARQAGESRSRVDGWSARVVGPDARPTVIMGVALGAGAIEAASMLPYLGAIGLIGSSSLALPLQLVVLSGYAVVMCLPAMALLVIRQALGERAEQALGRWQERISKLTGGAIWWVVGILGFWIAADAAGRLFGWAG